MDSLLNGHWNNRRKNFRIFFRSYRMERIKTYVKTSVFLVIKNCQSLSQSSVNGLTKSRRESICPIFIKLLAKSQTTSHPKITTELDTKTHQTKY